VPANLPAEAKAAWLKVMEAKTPEEKIRAMEEFLSSVPKHKGTEKLIKHIRRRMAELKREMQGGGRRSVVCAAAAPAYISRRKAIYRSPWLAPRVLGRPRCCVA